MERRELLKMISMATGAAFIGGDFFLTGCKTEPSIGGAVFNAADIAFLDEMADTILPATKSPGAKAAKVGQFITVMVNDCYNKDDQKVIHEGITKLEEASKKANSKSFLDASPDERKVLLIALDKEAKDYEKARDSKPKNEKGSSHYFTMMKQLTLFGFFTSKEGATEALRYVEVPGKYDGDVPYKKGDKSWSDG